MESRARTSTKGEIQRERRERLTPAFFAIEIRIGKENRKSEHAIRDDKVWIIPVWYGQQDLNRAQRRFDVLRKVELLRCVGDLLRKSVRFCEPQLPIPKNRRSKCPACFLVRATGLEPAHRKVLDPKSNASANSATPALILPYFIINFQSCQPHFSLFLRPVRRFFAKSA